MRTSGVFQWLLAATLSVALLAAPQPARSVEPITTSMLIYGAITFGAGYLGSKAIDNYVWDPAFGNANVNELKKRLDLFEQNIRLAAAQAGNANAELRRDLHGMADRLATFRKELNDKVTKAEVRDIVEDVLTKLRDRVAKLDARIGGLEGRATKLEGRFTDLENRLSVVLPHHPPELLVQSLFVEVSLDPHPLIVEWLKLVARSEVNRLEIDRLERKYARTAPRLQPLLATEKAILAESAALHDKVKKACEAHLAKRQELVNDGLKDEADEMREHDGKLPTLTWLLMTTQPMADGKYKGRLAVPAALLGPQGSELLDRYTRAGGDADSLTAVFHSLLLLPADEAAETPLPEDLARAAATPRDTLKTVQRHLRDFASTTRALHEARNVEKLADSNPKV